MKISNPLAILLILICATIPSQAQKAEFKWETPLCINSGTFEESEVSREQIEATRKLISFGMGLPLQTEHMAWKPSDIEGLSLAKLDEEYRKVLADLTALKPVDSEFFRELKRRHLITLRRSYELKRVTLKAHSDRRVLVDFKPNHSGNEIAACYKKWGAPAAAGGESLLASWRVLLDEQMKINAAPDRLKARFDERYSSTDRDRWALAEVLGFGWWNCVNRTIPYVEMDGSAEREFRKLFRSVKSECDEP